jgi:hypothetical protein
MDLGESDHVLHAEAYNSWKLNEGMLAHIILANIRVPQAAEEDRLNC